MGAAHSGGVQLPALPPAVWLRVAHGMLHLEVLHAAACVASAASTLVRPAEGIYRVPGSHTSTQEALAYLNSGEHAPARFRLNDLASALKLCLRAHAPITGYTTCDALLAGGAVGEAELLSVCASLPPLSQCRLDFIARHVVRLSRASHVNLMPISNMSKFWGSILTRPGDDAAEDIRAELALGHAQYMFAVTLLTWYDRVMPPTVIGEPGEDLNSDGLLHSPPLFARYGAVLYAPDGASRVASVHDAVVAWRASRRPSQESHWGRVNTDDFAAALERRRAERAATVTAAAATSSRRPSAASNASGGSHSGGGVGGFARSIIRRISVFGGAEAPPKVGGASMPPPPPTTPRLERAVTDSGSPVTPHGSGGGGIMNFLTGRRKAAAAAAPGTTAAGQQSIAQAAAAMGRTASAPIEQRGGTEEDELAAWERTFGHEGAAPDEPAGASVSASPVDLPRARSPIIATRGIAAGTQLDPMLVIASASNASARTVAAATAAAVAAASATAAAEYVSPWGFSKPAAPPPPAPPPAAPPPPPPAARSAAIAVVRAAPEPPSRGAAHARSETHPPALRENAREYTGVGDDSYEDEEAGEDVYTSPHTGPVRGHAFSRSTGATPATGARESFTATEDGGSSVRGHRRVSVDAAPMLSPGTRSVARRHTVATAGVDAPLLPLPPINADAVARRAMTYARARDPQRSRDDMALRSSILSTDSFARVPSLTSIASPRDMLPSVLRAPRRDGEADGVAFGEEYDDDDDEHARIVAGARELIDSGVHRASA